MSIDDNFKKKRISVTVTFEVDVIEPHYLFKDQESFELFLRRNCFANENFSYAKNEVAIVKAEYSEAMQIKNLDELETYIFGNSIVTCPKCGARTNFTELAVDKQQHKCLGCSYEFLVDIEDV